MATQLETAVRYNNFKLLTTINLAAQYGVTVDLLNTVSFAKSYRSSQFFLSFPTIFPFSQAMLYTDRQGYGSHMSFPLYFELIEFL